MKTVSTSPDRLQSAIDDGVAKLLARAADSRGVTASEVRGRVENALQKYLFRDNDNVSDAEVREFLTELRADDLCLVLACERNDAAAWEYLVATQDATVRGAARKIASSTEDADDLASSIWAELYGLRQDADGKIKSKLSYYSGRGSLGGWLRAIVGQLAVDEFRKQSRLVQIEEPREFEVLAAESATKQENRNFVAASATPEAILDEKMMSSDVSRSVRTSIAALSDDERLLLKLYYFENMKLKDLAEMFGYHEATASRKLARIQNDLRKSIEKTLIDEHRWKPDEVQRHLRETALRLGLNLESLVGLLVFAAMMQEWMK